MKINKCRRNILLDEQNFYMFTTINLLSLVAFTIIFARAFQPDVRSFTFRAPDSQKFMNILV